MNRTLLCAVIGGALSVTAFGCSGDSSPSNEIVRIRTATATECPDGGQAILVGIDGNDDNRLEGAEIISTSPVCNGSVGDPGEMGIPGTNALVVTAAEAAGNNCASGGTRLDVGIDDDGNGTLDAGEIDATSYICNGADGADGRTSLTRTSTNTAECGAAGGVAIDTGIDTDGNGTLEDPEVTNTSVACNGRDGARSLVDVTPEPTGANCVAGGLRIDAGVDENGDGVLTGIEIGDTSYVCNAINNLVSVTAELAGTSTICPNGGSRIQVGLDVNTNAVLDPTEVTQTSFSCSGANGSSSLVSVTPEAAGANCANGGQRVDNGVDTNANGTLEAGEIISTSFVCNGANGQAGQDGVDGQNGALVRVSAEVAGANCINGGSRIETGLDANQNGTLEAGEVTTTSYVCDGASRESLVTSTPVAPGPNCANGGARIDGGLDLDGDGMLDTAEITSTAFVCNGMGMVPFAIQTAMLPDGVANQPYAATLSAAGGTGGNYTWSIVAGALPPGLTLEPMGTPSTTLSGLPTGGGNFTFTVQVTDFFGQAASRQFTIVVAGPVLAITTFVVPDIEVGTPYNFTLGAVGGAAPYTWSVVQAALPAGLTLATNGTISGTPTVNLDTDVQVRVTDNGGATRDARLDFHNQRNWVAFSADATTDTVVELYVVDVSGATPGMPITISPTPVAGGSLGQTTSPVYSDARMSRSGDKISFVGDFATDGAEEIWFVDLRGATPSAPVRANTPFTATTQDVDADDHRWSDDSRWLAFIADDVNDSEFNLFVIDTDAATPTPVQVNGVLPSGSDVDTSDSLRFSPDSTRLAYISDEETAAVETLYVVDLTSFPLVPQRVSLGGATADVSLFKWTHDSSALVYAADDLTDGIIELFISNVSGASPTAPVRLNTPFSNSSGDVGTSVSFDRPSDFGVSPDSQRVFYIADARTESVDELYVVDIANPGAARLVSHDGVTGTADDVDRAFWTPDSQSLVFVSDSGTSGVLEVFIGDATGTAAPIPTTLNAPFVTNGDVSQGTAAFSANEVVVDPNNRGVYFMADGVTDTVESLFFSPFDAPGTMVDLAPNIDGTEDVNSFQVSKNGNLVVWNGDPTGSAIDEVYAVDTSGSTFGAPARVNGPLVTNGDVNSGATTTARGFDIVGSGRAVIYIADEITDAQDQPFYCPINAGVPGTSVPMITPVAGGNTFDVYR